VNFLKANFKHFLKIQKPFSFNHKENSAKALQQAQEE
jgi:hypothetical protein